MPDDVVQAIKAGGLDAHKQLDQDGLKLTTSIGLFGTPEQMAGKYKERALGALAGIYGNTAEEAVCPAYLSDTSGQILDTSKFNYRFTFEPGNFHPSKYSGRSRCMTARLVSWSRTP